MITGPVTPVIWLSLASTAVTWMVLSSEKLVAVLMTVPNKVNLIQTGSIVTDVVAEPPAVVTVILIGPLAVFELPYPKLIVVFVTVTAPLASPISRIEMVAPARLVPLIVIVPVDPAKTWLGVTPVITGADGGHGSTLGDAPPRTALTKDPQGGGGGGGGSVVSTDRKSTRLNSSHLGISYAVF